MEVIVLNDKQSLKNEKIDEWLHGKRPDGTDIGIYQSKDYEIFKYKINPLAHGTIDLILTGQTASTLFPKKGSANGLFTFGMNDRHNLLRFGKDILGLNQQWFVNRQKEVYVSKLMKEIKSKYKIA